MARIIVATYAVRFPLGGVLSWVLQWLAGFERLGHEVYAFEQSGWDDSCYDPSRRVMSDDATEGMRVWRQLLETHGLGDRWCYVDAQGRYHGMSATAVDAVFRSADVYVDMTADAFGLPGRTWNEACRHAGARVFIDGEPGYYQPRLEQALREGAPVPAYDHYYTVGLNVGTQASTVPTLGLPWRHIVDPVVPDLFPLRPVPAGAPMTTVMSWQAHSANDFEVSGYQQKDAEFLKFIDLPSRVSVPMELAVGGARVPRAMLQSHGWRVRDAQDVTLSFEAFRDYIAGSLGEFSACKNVFVATNSGFFSDRSAAYLASGRPVVMQDTGFSAHLPCGTGLIAVTDLEEAIDAVTAIVAEYDRHATAARAVAEEHLNASLVLGRLLQDIGVA